MSLILKPADMPRAFLDAAGNPVEPRSPGHVITHYLQLGLMFDVRAPKRVSSRVEAREVAAGIDLLGRKGEWIIGQDYEEQHIIDRRFSLPAVDPDSFPNMPETGWIYTDTPVHGSSGHVWFVLLGGGGVGWYGGDLDGLAVPCLRVPPSQ